MEEVVRNQEENDEKEIDLLELAMTLWKQRKKIIKWCVCGAVLGLVIAFSIPKEYDTEVKLSPELSDNKTASGGVSAMLSAAGLTGGSAGADAVYPMLYPDVVSSVPFVTSLFNVEVTTKGSDDEPGVKTTVQDFLENDTKSPWWGVLLGLPGKIIGAIKGGDEESKDHKLDNFKLTQKEYQLVEALRNRVVATVDTKTSVVTINVKMQDPVVSAILADTVVARLQQYITAYRTNKARKDLEYMKTLNDEAKDNYYKAQQRFADYLDRNQGIAFHSAQTVRDRLENEATLAFNLYNQTAQQVQKAQAKVQETTPAFEVLVPATVPLKPASPRKLLILVGFTFLAFVACAAWILFLKPMVDSQKEKLKEEKEEESSEK